MMEKTTLYLPAELHRSLREVARREKRSQSEIIRAAIEEYLAGKRRPVLRSIGIGEDGELAARDSEDWLRAEWGRRL
ncbi:ribbon-helix-helix protein, CopG family [Rubrobacter taiwanensis]|jgi:predicted transcriptional regulator|nr:ribbon-helix-helix protein, CopG family [Rubrobacter taiwanensis]